MFADLLSDTSLQKIPTKKSEGGYQAESEP